MARAKKQDAATDETGGADVQTTAEADKPAGKSKAVTIVLKRPMQVGDVMLETGDKLAEVTLEPGVALGFLTRAIDDGHAGRLVK